MSCIAAAFGFPVSDGHSSTKLQHCRGGKGGRAREARHTETYTWCDLRHGREAAKGVCFDRLVGVRGLDVEGGLDAHHCGLLVLGVVVSGG